MRLTLALLKLVTGAMRIGISAADGENRSSSG